MIQLMKKIALDAVNASSPMEIIEAVITSPPPEIKIKLKSDSKLVIPKDLIIVSEHLTNHFREIKVNDGAVQQYEFMDELKTGDEVMVATLQGGQFFFIFDRAKKY